MSARTMASLRIVRIRRAQQTLAQVQQSAAHATVDALDDQHARITAMRIDLLPARGAASPMELAAAAELSGRLAVAQDGLHPHRRAAQARAETAHAHCRTAQRNTELADRWAGRCAKDDAARAERAVAAIPRRKPGL